MDRDALVDALKSGRLGGVGMDIGYAEPAEPDDPLLAFDKGNVILQPHLAIAHRENGLIDMRQVALNLWRATRRSRHGRRRRLASETIAYLFQVPAMCSGSSCVFRSKVRKS